MVTLTKTTILDFLACEKKYYLGQVIGYQRKDRSKVMVVGTMLHLAKELLAKEMQPNKVKQRIQKEMGKIFSENMFTGEICKEIETIAFHGAYNAPWPVLPGTEVEKLVRIPMADLMEGVRFEVSPDLEYGCRIDEVVPLRDSVKLVDYKTKDSLSNVGLSWFEKVLSLDLQQVLYREAYAKATSEKVSEFEFRFIKRPGIRQRKGETHGQYLARIAMEYTNTNNQDKYYADCVAPAHNAHLVLENLQRVMARLAYRYDHGGWEMNPLSCISYNSACKYLPICYSEPGWKDLYEERGPDHHPELESDNEKRERTTESGTQEF